jgi:ribose transport system ATP-binding protein
MDVPLLLDMREIRKSFASGEVLHGVDFRLGRGEIHAVVGHNGAGKSTLMKILAGVHADFDGRIAIDGKEAQLRSPRDAAGHNIAAIYQDFALVPDLSVAANIALGREPQALGGLLIDHGAMRRRSAVEAREFGIDLPMDVPVRELGVAGKQMTEIVRALAKRAHILIMDEPTARLAPHEREHLFQIMQRLARGGVGIIYISHFLEEVEQVADRVTVLRDGHVVASRPVAAFEPGELTHLIIGPDAARNGAGQAAAAHADAGQRPTVLELVDFSVRGRPPVSFAIGRSEVLGLAGLVGSGRTSLGRGIIGDLHAGGALHLEGHKVAGRWDPVVAAARGVVMLPEDRKATGLSLTASVRDNIELTALGPRLSRFGLVAARRRDQAVRQAIERFRIVPPDASRIVGQLSGGNAQKVLLARAVTASPKVLILDQPTAGVDVGAKAETHRQIRRIVADGTSVLLICDDLDELLDLSDRIAIVTSGVVSSIRPATAFDRPGLLAAISRTSEAAA